MPHELKVQLKVQLKVKNIFHATVLIQIVENNTAFVSKMVKFVEINAAAPVAEINN